MTVNQCWQGRRFKTPAYKQYEEHVSKLLPLKMDIPEGPLKMTLIFGVSNNASDWDNPIKPFQDILQKAFGFNDSRIREAKVVKVIVPKGEEFIVYEIDKHEPDGFIQRIGLDNTDVAAHEKEVLGRVNELAAQFAELYIQHGLKEKKAIDKILSEAVKFDKRMVVNAFRLALKEKGVRSVEGLV